MSSQRGRRGLPCDELYRQLFNPNLYLLAYGRIYSNQGAMTPGVAGETVDGVSTGEDRTHHRRDAPRAIDSARRVYIPKKSGKLRPLGIPTWSDKLVGEVVFKVDHSTVSGPAEAATPRSEKVAEPGPGRPGSSRATSPTVSGHLIRRQIMLDILAERIHDNRFLRLVRNMLQAGYLEDWEWNATYSGTPQGGVASPAFCPNVYLHRLDTFVERSDTVRPRGIGHPTSSTSG